MKPLTVHRVEFSDCPAGSCDLAWGQQWVARWLERFDYLSPTINVRKDGPVTGARSVEDVLRAIRIVVGRHEALRTRLRPDDDGVYRRQTVESGGEFGVAVHAADPGTLDEVTAGLRAWARACARCD